MRVGYREGGGFGGVGGVALAVIVVGLGLRLLLLGGPLDVPDWRQADTGYMAWRMWQEKPPEVLYPKAPFRGAEDVKAAEFPIYPLVVSAAWKVIGGENLPAARVVTLLFFIGAAWYLYRSVEMLGGRRQALAAATVYVILPLGIPYSRMVHPDFCIIFFSHMFFFYALRFARRRRALDYLVATAACSLVFLMKAPYGFYFGLPLALFVWREQKGARLRGLAALAGMFVVPLALGWWFNGWRIGLESGHAESLVYPMKWTAESLRARFFGSLAERFDGRTWEWLLRRSVILVFTVPGALLAAWGAVAAPAAERELRPAAGYLWALILGVAGYVLLVFPMVASDHDYYSLPFLFPAAWAAALGLEWLLRRPFARGAVRAAVAGGVFVLLMAGSVYGIRRGPFLYGPPYFTHDWQRIAAGKVIEEETGPDDLVLTVTLGRSTGWSDPRILYYAHRRGWAREGRYLKRADLDEYISAGATAAALLLAPDYAPVEKNFGVLAGYPFRVRRLHDARGNPIGNLVLFDLKRT